MEVKRYRECDIGTEEKNAKKIEGYIKYRLVKDQAEEQLTLGKVPDRINVM